MFFLGLAGSFMPYLLLMGALFVLTLGVNMKADKETEVVADKTIEYQHPNKQEVKTDDCCHFHQTAKANANDLHNLQAERQQDTELLICHPPDKTIFSLVHHSYSFDIYRTYGGLSPPVLIS
jgi:hypothetical protein